MLNGQVNSSREGVAFRRFSRTMGYAALAITCIIAVSLVVWRLFDPSRTVASIAVALVVTSTLSALSWVVVALPLRFRPDLATAGVAGGYFLKLLLIGITLFTARAHGGDTQVIASAVLAAVLFLSVVEISLLARLRFPVVNVPLDDPSR